MNIEETQQIIELQHLIRSSLVKISLEQRRRGGAELCRSILLCGLLLKARKQLSKSILRLQPQQMKLSIHRSNFPNTSKPFLIVNIALSQNNNGSIDFEQEKSPENATDFSQEKKDAIVSDSPMEPTKELISEEKDGRALEVENLRRNLKRPSQHVIDDLEIRPPDAKILRIEASLESNHESLL